MADQILNAYSFSSDENKLIKASFAKHSDWENAVFDDTKENIVKHLRGQQDDQCCYCKRDLGHDIKDVDIEHIIPKSKHEEFTFYPKNLALSCPGCNTSKSTKDVLAKKIKLYPRSAAAFTIVHAHFDRYGDHIEIHDSIIYEGLSDKGCETIKKCKLFRLKKVAELERKKMTEKSPIRKLVEEIRKGDVDDVEELMVAIFEKIKGKQAA